MRLKIFQCATRWPQRIGGLKNHPRAITVDRRGTRQDEEFSPCWQRIEVFGLATEQQRELKGVVRRHISPGIFAVFLE